MWEIKKGYTNQITVKTLNHTLPQTEIFDFVFGNLIPQNVIYNQPQKYLYEPNAAIMKSGGFNDVALQFNLDKLHPNSHLFTNQELINFPGRCFEIKEVVLYKKKNLKSILKNKTLNISTRNFNESVNEIKKKWNIKDGGNTYCFFTTTIDEEKVILFCEKIKNTVL